MIENHSARPSDQDRLASKRGSVFASVTTLDRLTVGYLLLPNLIFLAGWLKPIWGVPAVILLSLAAVSLLWNSHPLLGFSKSKLAVCFALALVWLFLSGIGHYVYANDDWIVRDAVYADLIKQPWPVEYVLPENDTIHIMRAPLGYYLPPALFSSIAGIEYADLAIFCWSLAGLCLVFYSIANRSQSTRETLCRLLIFVFFSGMDVIGNLLLSKYPSWGQHLEWWGGRFQFSSNTTALFWVPNHALGCWLAILWLLNQKRGPLNLPLSVLIAACTPLWSPLSAAGLIPFFAMAVLLKTTEDPRSVSEKLRSLLNWQVGVTVLALTILVYPYLLLYGETIQSGWALRDRPVLNATLQYLAFVVLEFAALTTLLLYRYPRDRYLWVAGGLLFLIPLYCFGPASDFSMRASLPALAIISKMLGDWAAEFFPASKTTTHPTYPERWQGTAFAAAMVLFAIGTVTPIFEMIRGIQKPRWNFDPDKTLVSVGAATATHYVCPRNSQWISTFLRD